MFKVLSFLQQQQQQQYHPSRCIVIVQSLLIQFNNNRVIVLGIHRSCTTRSSSITSNKYDYYNSSNNNNNNNICNGTFATNATPVSRLTISPHHHHYYHHMNCTIPTTTTTNTPYLLLPSMFYPKLQYTYYSTHKNNINKNNNNHYYYKTRSSSSSNSNSSTNNIYTSILSFVVASSSSILYVSLLCPQQQQQRLLTSTRTIPTTLCDAAVVPAVTTLTTTNDDKNNNNSNSNDVVATESTTPTTTTSTTTQFSTQMKKSNIQRKMTSIGRFALVSETPSNPSIITFCIQLQNHHHAYPITDTSSSSATTTTTTTTTASKGSTVLTAKELMHIWNTKHMEQRHPRFHQMVHNDMKRPLLSSSSSSYKSVSNFHPHHTTTIQQHIVESILPMNRNQLQYIIGQLQTKQWDLSTQLWDITLCNNTSTYSNNIYWNPFLSTKLQPRTFLTNIDKPKNTNTDVSTTATKLPESNCATNASYKQEQQHVSDVVVVPPTLLLFRGHHVLADGASMAAAFMDLFDEADILRQQIVDTIQQYRMKRKLRNKQHRSIFRWIWKIWVQLVHLCYGIIMAYIHVVRLFLYQVFVDENPWKQIQLHYNLKRKEKKVNVNTNDSVFVGSSSNGTTINRIVSWTDVATVEQAKWVADTLSDGTKKIRITINDIFISCVSAAIAKQLQYHRRQLQELESLVPTTTNSSSTSSSKRNNKNRVLPEQKFLHVAIPVHLKGGVVLPNESVGNNIGALVARVPCEVSTTELSTASDDNECVERLLAVSKEMNTIKRTPLAIIGYGMAKILSNVTSWNLLPTSITSYLYSRANAGSLVAISNNRGPSIPVHIDGHKVESITGFVPLPPGIPIGIVVMSYAGQLNCTVSAEPWAIPDGDQFMVWMLEEYVSLVKLAQSKEGGNDNGTTQNKW